MNTRWKTTIKPSRFWVWLLIALGVLYFFLPLICTLYFSLSSLRGGLSLAAYENVFSDPRFFETFLFSLEMALLTIVVSLVLIVPTVYWCHMRVPRLRPVIEFITLLPLMVPAIVLVFGLIAIYSRPPLVLTGSAASLNVLLVAGYVVLAMPFMYWAVDNGLRSIDARTLTEAAQSLGASLPTILVRVVVPNIRVAILSGVFLTLAVVIGELTLAQYLARPAFGPYMALVGHEKAYEPAALAIISFALTWTLIGAILLLSHAPKLTQIGSTK